MLFPVVPGGTKNLTCPRSSCEKHVSYMCLAFNLLFVYVDFRMILVIHLLLLIANLWPGLRKKEMKKAQNSHKNVLGFDVNTTRVKCSNSRRSA